MASAGSVYGAGFRPMAMMAGFQYDRAVAFRIGRTAVMVLAVAALAWLCARLVLLLLAGGADYTVPNPASATARSQTMVASTQYSLLEQTTPFRAVSETETGSSPQRAEDVDAPVTALNLTLHGVFLGEGERGIAYISVDENGEQAGYRVDDQIEGAAGEAEGVVQWAAGLEFPDFESDYTFVALRSHRRIRRMASHLTRVATPPIRRHVGRGPGRIPQTRMAPVPSKLRKSSPG